METIERDRSIRAVIVCLGDVSDRDEWRDDEGGRTVGRKAKKKNFTSRLFFIVDPFGNKSFHATLLNI